MPKRLNVSAQTLRNWDMIQIVTVFNTKLQGKRANKAKKMIKELIEDDTIKED